MTLPVLTLASFLAASSLVAAQPTALPKVWTWEENGWTGTWSRRGDTATYDIHWSKGASTGASVATIHITGPRSFCAHRQDTKAWAGQEVDYSGTLAEDGTARGTGRVRSSGPFIEWRARPGGGQVPSPEPDKDLLGSHWRTEENGWTGTWTRRGTSNTFDIAWVMGSQHGSSVATVTLQGRTLSVQRRDHGAWAGQEVDYTATLDAHGSFSGKGTMRHTGFTYPWKGRIQ